MIRRQTAGLAASAIPVCCDKKDSAKREFQIRRATPVILSEVEGSRCGSFKVISAESLDCARETENKAPLQSRNVSVANESWAHLSVLDLAFVRARHFEIEHAHSESLLTLVSPAVAR